MGWNSATLKVLCVYSFLLSTNASVFAMISSSDEEEPRNMPQRSTPLLERKNAKAELVFETKECSSILERPLIELDPSPEGQTSLHQKIVTALGAIQGKGASRAVRLAGNPLGGYFISQETAQDLCGWDCYGFAKAKENALGNRRVIRRGEVHFKLSPGGGYGDKGAINDLRPGMEGAVSSFFKLLGRGETYGLASITIAPPSTLLVLEPIEVKDLDANLHIPNSPYLWVRERAMTGQASCVEEVLNRNPDVKEVLEVHAKTVQKRAVFQASLTIEGENLDTILTHPEAYQTFCRTLDKATFTTLFLGTLLTNPFDGNVHNYIATKVGLNKHGLVCIDNDESFISSILRLPKSKGHIPNVKAIPFFLPIMDKKFDKRIKQNFLQKTPGILLYEWVQSLEDQNDYYASLVNKGILSDKALHNMFLPIRLAPGLLKEMYGKICLIQKTLRENPTLTYKKIFKKVEPLLYRYYRALTQLSQNKEELFTLVDRYRPDTRPAFEELLKKNLPLPTLGMFLLQDRDLGGPFTFEELFPDNQQVKNLLAEAVSREAPFVYEEYEQQTIPLVESLHELIEINADVSDRVFTHASKLQDSHSLHNLLSWGLGPSRQLISHLCSSRLPLKHLNLRSKSFIPEEVRQLGKALQQRTELMALSLTTDHKRESSHPTIDSLSMESILEGLQNLPSLTSLVLEGYNVSPSGALYLQRLSQLQDLSLAYAKLNTNDTFPFLRMSHLQRLNLVANGIQAAGAGLLLDNLKQLTSLNLSRNKGILGSNSVYSYEFLAALKRHPSLTVLDLSHGEINNDALEKLAEALKAQQSLTSLNLYYNAIYDKASLKGLEDLGNNPRLQHINLGNNRLANQGTLALIHNLKRNKGTLRVLDLSYNSINEEGAKALKQVLRANTSLQTLNLKKNSLGDKGINHILKALHHNRTLTELHLGSTGISAGDMTSLEKIFHVLRQNEGLTLINISGNDEALSRLTLSHHIRHLNAYRQGRGVPPVTIIHLLGEEEQRK